MSYIRSTSNHEGLYIWGDCRGRVHVSHHIAPPLASDGEPTNDRDYQGFTVPRHVFEHVCREWHRRGGAEVRYRGLRVRELATFLDDGTEATGEAWMGRRRYNIFVRLEYGAHFLSLWHVTWTYVVNNVVRRR